MSSATDIKTRSTPDRSYAPDTPAWAKALIEGQIQLIALTKALLDDAKEASVYRKQNDDILGPAKDFLKQQLEDQQKQKRRLEYNAAYSRAYTGQPQLVTKAERCARIREFASQHPEFAEEAQDHIESQYSDHEEEEEQE